jgi:hypothetical protein
MDSSGPKGMTNREVVITRPGAKVFGQTGVPNKARFRQGEGRETPEELNQEKDRKQNKES